MGVDGERTFAICMTNIYSGVCVLDTKMTNPLSRSNTGLRLYLYGIRPRKPERRVGYSTNLIYRLTCFVLLALGEAVLHGKGAIIERT